MLSSNNDPGQDQDKDQAVVDGHELFPHRTHHAADGGFIIPTPELFPVRDEGDDDAPPW